MKIQFRKDDISNRWLSDVVSRMNETLNTHIIIENNRMIFPPDIAEGTCSYHKLSADVEISIVDLTTKSPLVFERLATKNDLFYTMHINCSPHPVDHFVNGKKHKIGGTANSGIYWSSSDVPFAFKIEPDKKFQAVFICISKEYLQSILWDSDSPIGVCTIKNKMERVCVLKANGDYECDLDKGIERCIINKDEHIIASSLYCSLGTAKYNLVQEIIRFDKDSTVPEKIVIKGDVLKILALFIKKVASEKKKQSENKMQFGDAARIMTIKKTIDEGAHFKHFSLEELARLVGMSKTKMKVKFKEIVGTSVYKYYIDIRMQRAKDMLYSNPRSITTLAYEMGFKTVSHFSQLYKKYHGINPNSIIVENRKNYF
ncbi:helix-turn-helix domain-containing protein [Pinibacter soli]|uniref:Helix-turn-helix transcriptional regulator n=1 Tax=Pinibacter soli TaxID=3044211 RepID=A0ABT6R6E8_9BACT|nr:helix-turn-helix transcriptional regulator [Pinibacter soli]MDI3318143.1 helix-turn-helix transcriptional regulator [Pinibacter soli]